MPTIRVMLQAPDLTLGEFHCWPGDPSWRRENSIGAGHHVVFPGTGVRITQAGAEPVVTNPNHLVFYNDGQTYRRELVSEAGDHCVYLIPAPELLREALAEFRPDLSVADEVRLPFVQGPSDHQTFRLRRAVVRYLSSDAPAKAAPVREALYVLLRRALALGSAIRSPARRRRRGTERDHAELAEATKHVITERFAQPLSLGLIAREVHVTPTTWRAPSAG